MCGWVGLLHPSEGDGDGLAALVDRMSASLSHRGPDDSGKWVDSGAAVALGHRRLSVVDLSPQGHQPMLSASKRYVIAFNGEIYNHRRLRSQLDKEGSNPAWRGHSDTEVMLAAFERWGIEGALGRFNGMFSFALWDRREKTLHLARDRFGEKPLYYGWVGRAFLSGSELKAFKLHPEWPGGINRSALALYMRHNYVPAPHSIYEGIFKLQPGHFISISFEDGRRGLASSKPYWDAKLAAEVGNREPLEGEPDLIIDSLDHLLRDAVGIRMEADVPLGAFLSGGYDSTTIAALMQSQSSQPVKTFSIGFDEPGYNEAVYAKAVAKYLGTEHTELYVTPEQAMAVIPRLPEIYDEPFSDSSQIPTFLVSEMTRQHVTVALSGDAGDELFGGYERYKWGRKIWRTIGWMPDSLRSLTARALESIPPETWDKVFAKLDLIRAVQKKSFSRPGDKIHKLGQILSCGSPEELYRGLVSHWSPETIVPDVIEPRTALDDPLRQAELSNFTQSMMFLDLITYLPDDILVKVDRASMAVSLEARVPFLDHRIAEFAWRVPDGLKIKKGKGKWILREVLHRYVPKELMERPKMGFGVPLDKWLRGPLRGWAEGLLDEKKISQEGFFDAAGIQRKWKEHLSGTHNWAYHLWDVLMFEAWLEEY